MASIPTVTIGGNHYREAPPGAATAAMPGADDRSRFAMPSNIIELRPSLAVQALHAYYDEATGLPNQMLFMDRLSHALLGASRRGSGVAVFFIDVRPIAAGMDDDSLDEAAAAALWRGVAERLENRLRP